MKEEKKENLNETLQSHTAFSELQDTKLGDKNV